MVPQLAILATAIIGAVVGGWTGFFVWGILGLVGILALGKLLVLFSGGLLPRKVRDETATDFIVAHGATVKDAFPHLSPFQAKEAVATLLDEMYRQATIENPSMRLDVAGDPRVFLLSAMKIADEQSTEAARVLGRELVAFVATHSSWYGKQ